MATERTRGRKIAFSLISMLLLLVIFAFLGELLVWIFNPRATIYPAMKYSPEYGAVLYNNEVIVHQQPRHFKFLYTVNSLGYRGKEVPISNSYDKTNIVILGDSFSFGHGVQDGQQYASILWDSLANDYNVINLGVGGWGLTQEIRRFYEFGQLYNPKIVILQFFHNDPVDNLNNQVTVIENGRFEFKNSNSKTNWLKKYLSHSIIQKSQFYNLLRTGAISLFKGKMDEAQKEEFAEKHKISGIPPEEKYYNDLLELFAKDMKRRNIELLFFSVNDALPKFPHIKDKVLELNEEKMLKFIDIDPWFKTPADVEPSPAGHYGPRWNYLVGTNLAEYIKASNDSTINNDSTLVN